MSEGRSEDTNQSPLTDWFVQQPRWVQVMCGAVVLVILIGVMSLLSNRIGGGPDWYLTHRPASLAVLHGQSPYSINDEPGRDGRSYFFNPPWTVIPLLPLAMLPPELSRAAFIVVGLLAYGYAAWRLGGSVLTVVLFLLSPPVLMNLWNANIDWLVILGFALPPQIGLFFVTTKPQMAFGVVLFWFVQALREGGIRSVVRIFGPFTLVTLISLAMFGMWPLLSLQVEFASSANASLWPLSIPLGLVGLAAAFKEEKVEFAMAASPFLTPYIVFHSYVGALISLVKSRVYFVVAVAGLYLFGFVQMLTMSQ